MIADKHCTTSRRRPSKLAGWRRSSQPIRSKQHARGYPWLRTELRKQAELRRSFQKLVLLFSEHRVACIGRHLWGLIILPSASVRNVYHEKNTSCGITKSFQLKQNTRMVQTSFGGSILNCNNYQLTTIKDLLPIHGVRCAIQVLCIHSNVVDVLK